MPSQHSPRKIHYKFWIDRFVLAKLEQEAASQGKGTATIFAEALAQFVEDVELPKDKIAEIESQIKQGRTRRKRKP